MHRPKRLIDHARAVCPSATDAVLERALEQAVRPAAGSSAASLERQAVAALQAGDLSKARRSSAHWLATMQAQIGEPPQSFPRPAGGRVVGYTPDGSAIIIATDSHRSQGSGRTSTLTVVDGETGLPTHVIEPGSFVNHADLTDEQLLAVGSGGLQLWSLRTGKQLRRLSWAGESYAWAAFADRGRRVVAVGSARHDLTVRVYETATGNNVGSVTPPDSDEGTAAALIDERRLLVLSGAKLFIVDLASFKIIGELDPRPQPKPGKKRSRWDDEVSALAASPSGLVAAALRRGVLMVWRPPNPRPIAIIRRDKRIRAIELSEDGAQAFVGFESGFSGEIRTYEIQSGHALKSRSSGEHIRFAQHGTRVLVGGGRRGTVRLEDLSGKRLWPVRPLAWEISGVALSQGLVLAHERRGSGNSSIHFSTWYRGHVRSFEAEGYYGDVFEISPTGRLLGAVVSRKAWVWDLATGSAEPLPTPDGKGFPDGVVFGGESVLRMIFERPAATWSAALPFEKWTPELSPDGLDGFRGTALSSRGDAVTVEDGRLVAAETGTTIVPAGTGGFAFSGDGSRLFVGTKERLSWFTPSGEKLGSKALPCLPRHVAVDYRGALAAMWCGDKLMTFRPDGEELTLSDYGKSRGYVSVKAVSVSPSAGLIAVHEKHRVGMLDGDSLEHEATLTLSGGAPMLRSRDGRIMSWAKTPSWQRSVACRIGHRAFPFELCRDWLTDDAMLDALLAK